MDKKNIWMVWKYSKILACCIVFVFGFFFFMNVSNAQIIYPNDGFSDYVNKDSSDVVDTTNIVDPIRDWAWNIIESGSSKVDWIIGSDTKIKNHDDALKRWLSLVQNVMNWAIGLLWFVALVYLLYHGFLVLTGAWDEEKTKKWWKGLKIAATAIVWIWLSWLFVSFIFWLIEILAGT